jgi:integrase
MPKLTDALPKYRKHQSGQAVVTLSGVDFYLGPHSTKASRNEYDRIVGEWLAAGRQLPVKLAEASDLTIVELLARYWRFADQHYRKDGKPTGESDNIRYAVRPLKKIYGQTRVREFGPLALKALQLHMISASLSRGVINSRIGKIKRVFRWGVSEQLVPPDVLHGLQSVMGLQRCRTEARETKPIRPVDDKTIEATLPHLPAVVADMVRLQRLVGCRPSEICDLRPCDIHTGGQVWRYVPASHKTEHHGRERRIFIGPKGQDVLRKYLLRAPDSYCFSPAESERIRKQKMRDRRKTNVQPSQVDRRKKRPRRKPSDRYEVSAYRRAIFRACDKAGERRWAPNQLRHTAATEIRSRFGLEGAQTILGHSKANTTEIYAERDFAKAAAIMKEVG